MEYDVSNHAAKRMQERKIEKRWVDLALAEPDRDEHDPVDPSARHAFRRIAEIDNRVLRGVYNVIRRARNESSRFTLIVE